MLFDLRSRGRRRTVQVVYIGLAILIGAGLVLFGVGTGGGGGGLFGGLTGNSSSSGNSVVTGQVKAALAQTRKTPSSAAAWSNLVSARLSAANSVGYDSTTDAFTTAGKEQLTLLTNAYARYLTLVKSPDATTAGYAGRAYSALDQYGKAADAYQAVVQSTPGDVTGVACVALLSYAAGNDRVGQLAENQFLAKLPKSTAKATRTQYASEFTEAKTDKSVATQNC